MVTVARTTGDRRRTREPGVILSIVILGDRGDRSARSRRGRTQIPTVVIIIVIDEDHGFPCEVYDVGHARMPMDRRCFVVLWVACVVAKGSCQEKLSLSFFRRCWSRC
jgi:hypothetical protein